MRMESHATRPKFSKGCQYLQGYVEPSGHQASRCLPIPEQTEGLYLKPRKELQANDMGDLDKKEIDALMNKK